jgi:Flp pilus assembly secretin CpaC
MQSCQSLVIGGLLSNEVNKLVRKVPWLGDLPILGQFFRTTSTRTTKTELVIIVTPMILPPEFAGTQGAWPTSAPDMNSVYPPPDNDPPKQK